MSVMTHDTNRGREMSEVPEKKISSPGWKSDASAPTASTTPEASQPGMSGAASSGAPKKLPNALTST
jgi:hypothetical protein